jgi:parvulin-like peptidyl-prolyl isomerase
MKKLMLLISAVTAVFIYTACDTTTQEVKHDDTILTPPASSPAFSSQQTDSGSTAVSADAGMPSQENENFDTKKLDKGIVAIIGDYVLTRDKFRAITDYMGQKYDYKLNPEQEKEFIQFIVNKKLMAMDARSKGYADRPDIKMKYEWDFDDILSHAYYSDNVDKKSNVTDAEAKAYYTAHPGDFVQIKASHILVKSKQLAESLYNRIKDGEDFADIAKKYSEDDTTKAKGGDLGEFGRGTMVQEFEDAAFALDDGEVSRPVKSIYGWHIIKVFSRKKYNFDDSKDKIVQMIKEKKQQQAFDSVISALKKKYKVTVNESVAGN